MAMHECPLCGKDALTEKQGSFHFDPPPNIPGGPIVVDNAAWLACDECGEEILPHELSEALDAERYRRLGLLSPAETKRVREKTGLSAVDIAQLLGVGDKTYTRWETGRSIQNKANDTLIRLIDKNAELFALMDAERDPGRERLIGRYFNDLQQLKGSNDLAMAAHGGDLSITTRHALRERINEIRKMEEDAA